MKDSRGLERDSHIVDLEAHGQVGTELAQSTSLFLHQRHNQRARVVIIVVVSVAQRHAILRVTAERLCKNRQRSDGGVCMERGSQASLPTELKEV